LKLQSLFPERFANAQYNQTICTVLSHSPALPTFQMKYRTHIAQPFTVKLHWIACAWWSAIAYAIQKIA